MSGHSKWNNIKNRKGAMDTKRAATFNAIAKNIRIAVQQGKSGDPKFNATLRTQLDKARAANMPNDKVQKAINTGLGKGTNGQIHEVVYEGFGPGGVAILAVAHTDNANRTSGEIKFIFSRNNGSLGSPGSAMYMFQRHGDTYTCQMPMDIDDETILIQLAELKDALEANEDVEEVFLATNAFVETDEGSEVAA